MWCSTVCIIKVKFIKVKWTQEFRINFQQTEQLFFIWKDAVWFICKRIFSWERVASCLTPLCEMPCAVLGAPAAFRGEAEFHDLKQEDTRVRLPSPNLGTTCLRLVALPPGLLWNYVCTASCGFMLLGPLNRVQFLRGVDWLWLKKGHSLMATHQRSGLTVLVD